MKCYPYPVSQEFSKVILEDDEIVAFIGFPPVPFSYHKLDDGWELVDGGHNLPPRGAPALHFALSARYKSVNITTSLVPFCRLENITLAESELRKQLPELKKRFDDAQAATNPSNEPNQSPPQTEPVDKPKVQEDPHSTS